MSDVKPGDVFLDLDKRNAAQRKLRVVSVDATAARGGNGCIASGPVAVCERAGAPRLTRISAARLLTPHRFERIHEAQP